MRILHILDHGLPLHSGYGFRTRAIMKAQAAAGFEVAAITGVRHAAAPLDPQSPLEEEIEGLRFFRTPAIAAAPPLLAELGEVCALSARLEEVVAQWAPDLLHAHSPVLDALAADRVARRHRLPLVYEIRAFWEDAAVGNGTGTARSLRYRATRWLETRACRHADAVVTICEGLRRDLLDRGIEQAKILVSPNGVDLGVFGDPQPRDAAIAAELGLPDDAEVIGFIGSFYDYEGVDDLIAAMPALLAERPLAHLLLVGGGPMADALKKQAEASPVADCIHFVGRVPHEEVERYYGLVDVLAYPRKAMRLTELVTPLKPLEAMAQRKLVAASDVGGHRELIEDGVTGTLFAPDDPAAVATALAGLLADDAGRDARVAAGRAFIERERDWATNVSRYGRLYRMLAKEKDAIRAIAVESRGMTETKMLAVPVTAEPVEVDVAPARIVPLKQAQMAPILRSLSAAPVEAPLGVVLGGALGFALAAMPVALFEALIGASGLPYLTAAADAPVSPGLRAAIIMVSAVVAGLLTWGLLLIAGGSRPWRAFGARFGRGVEGLRIRRADAHPDAPTRQPILAGRDLGLPLMDVAIGDTRPVRSRAEPDGAAYRPLPMLELSEPIALLHPLDITDPLDGDGFDDVLELTERFDPLGGIAVAAPVAGRSAIQILLERLQSGLDRRSAAGVAAVPADGGDPALRAALSALDRLDARRG